MINDLISWVLDSVASINPIARTLIAGLFIMLETSFLVGLIIPGDTVIVLASTAIEDVPQYIFMIVTVMVFSMLGETLGFFVESGLARASADHGSDARWANIAGKPSTTI